MKGGDEAVRILTTDLFEGAYFLSQGMELQDIWLDRRRSKELVMFEFTGDKIEALKRDYRQGEALVNLFQLKASLGELKDRMFTLLREKNQRIARSGQGGRRDEIRRERAAGVKESHSPA